MADHWLALLGHLHHAARSYGEDLPLAGLGPGPLLQEAPAPSPTASTAPPAAARRGQAVTRPWEKPREVEGRGGPARSGSKTLRPASDRPHTQGEPSERMAALRTEVLPCTRCSLRQGATQVVFGEGNPSARLMFVCEAPGQVEDETGRPFVGRSGELLDKILHNAMGLRREDVFIANVNKCRPPGNRDPEPLEIASCLPWLRAQIKIINPDVIVTLGRVAMWNLLGITDSVGRMRGRELAYEGIPVGATWHPAYLLRNPAAKAATWADVKRINRLLGNPEVPDVRPPESQ